MKLTDKQLALLGAMMVHVGKVERVGNRDVFRVGDEAFSMVTFYSLSGYRDLITVNRERHCYELTAKGVDAAKEYYK